MPIAGITARLGQLLAPAEGEGPASRREWVRSDGLQVETEIQPLPTGGLLLTCTDVTAQRAAVAAEAASRAKLGLPGQYQP